MIPHKKKSPLQMIVHKKKKSSTKDTSQISSAGMWLNPVLFYGAAALALWITHWKRLSFVCWVGTTCFWFLFAEWAQHVFDFCLLSGHNMFCIQYYKWTYKSIVIVNNDVCRAGIFRLFLVSCAALWYGFFFFFLRTKRIRVGFLLLFCLFFACFYYK